MVDRMIIYVMNTVKIIFLTWLENKMCIKTYRCWLKVGLNVKNDNKLESGLLKQLLEITQTRRRDTKLIVSSIMIINYRQRQIMSPIVI